MDMLQLIESIRSDAADYQNRLESFTARREGVPVRSLRRRDDPAYHENLLLAMSVIERARKSRRGSIMFEEAMGTSDFPLYFGDVIDRQMLGMYAETPPTWSNYARRGTVPDFRDVKRFAFDGSEAVLDTVQAQAEYPEASMSETQYTYAVVKTGRRIPLSWELIVNDDLGAFGNIGARFARAARRTEEFRATQLFVDVNGPHASFYTAGNANIVNAANAGAGFTANNPPLSITALQQAFAVLGKMRDADDEPIMIDAVELVVTEGDEITARNILNATQIIVGADTAEQRILTNNWMRNNVRLSVNKYVTKIATSLTTGRPWFLFASPSSGRPALEVGFLRGHESPEIFLETANSQRLGGGLVSPLDGNFLNDSINYKVRHILGGTRLDPKATVASNGTGT